MHASFEDRIERAAVRIVLLDEERSVLLLSTRDASNPDFGASWELPGGGITQSESLFEAAVRELREESGFDLPISAIGAPQWCRQVLYTYRGERRLQRESICVARIHAVAPTISSMGREEIEREDHLFYRWWKIDDMRASKDRFYPQCLARHIDALIAGHKVEEPWETWDD